MKAHHEFEHARGTIKTYNNVVRYIDVCLFELKDQLPDGTILSQPVGVLKSYILANIQSLLAEFANVDKFLKGHETYDLTAHSNKSRDGILQEKLLSDDFGNRLQTAVSASSINTKAKLAQISGFSNPLTLGSPPAMFPSMHYMIILNDWLDSCSIVIKGYDYNSGQPKTWTDEQKKQIIRGWMNQFSNFATHPWPFEFQDEIDFMFSVRDWILANLDGLPLAEIAAYIDVNVPKIPLIRRVNFPV